MICVNKLKELKTKKREILEPLLIILSPFAPHIAEELWSMLGNNSSISYVKFPAHNDKYTKQNLFILPISFNGKTKLTLEFPIDTPDDIIKEELMKNQRVKDLIKDKRIKKIIIVKNKIVNFVF